MEQPCFKKPIDICVPQTSLSCPAMMCSWALSSLLKAWSDNSWSSEEIVLTPQLWSCHSEADVCPYHCLLVKQQSNLLLPNQSHLLRVNTFALDMFFIVTLFYWFSLSFTSFKDRGIFLYFHTQKSEQFPFLFSSSNIHAHLFPFLFNHTTLYTET